MGMWDTTTQQQQPGQETPSRPTLLIVDDEAGPRESLRMVFKDRYQCAIATCGKDGIEYARNHRIDAAILDIKMPDISGVDVLREIKQIDPNTECIMLTGYETLETARAAIRYGAAEYQNKPFDAFAMRALLEKCMARRQQRLGAEQTLQNLQKMNDDLMQDLAQSKRAVVAGVLSAGVVHEINNPLSIIAGYTQLLARDLAAVNSADPSTGEAVQKRLVAIQREIERCTGIARRFLSFSRANQSSEEVIEVAKLLDDTAALLKVHPSNLGVEIACSVSDPTLSLKVHPAEILQVLINLSVNALQAMNGKGTLQLLATPAGTVPAEMPFRAESFDPRRAHMKISVTDTGCGISPENLKKIFEPYFTTKQQGTGLGLAIICELIGQYGGAIDVQSAVGKGTTFSLYLPQPA